MLPDNQAKKAVGEFLFLAFFKSYDYLSEKNSCFIKNSKFNFVSKSNQTSNQNSPTRFFRGRC